MDVNDMMRLAESVGRDAAEMRGAVGDATVPRGQPLAGVTASAVARCRQIADQLAYLSGEMATQLRMYESSLSRGRRLARLQRSAAGAEPAEGRAATTRPTAIDEADDEADDEEWGDDL